MSPSSPAPFPGAKVSDGQKSSSPRNRLNRRQLMEYCAAMCTGLFTEIGDEEKSS
jgi:hypothetical protein